MKQRSLLSLALIVTASSAIAFFSLTRGHFWWDDFASYVMQAQAILAWNMDDFIAHNTFTVQNSSYPPGPVAYPWGFPLLLTPVVALFGVHPLALKLVGIAFFALFLIIFYFLARTRLDDQASLLLTGVFAFNPTLLQATNLILSDLPFLALSTLGLLLIEYLSVQRAPAPKQSLGERDRRSSSAAYRDLALGATLFFAAFLRTNGILLLVPLVVALLIADWPNWKTSLRRILSPLLTFSVLFVVSSLIFPGGQDSYLSHFAMFNLPRLWDNFLYYLWLPAWTFDNLPAHFIYYPLLAFGLLFSLFAHLKRDLALLAYSLATLGLYILWPERQGLRFIYPVLPILFILACDGLQLALSRLSAPWQVHAARALIGFWLILAIFSLVISAKTAYANMAAGRDINGPFDPVSKEMYNFIRAETPAEAVAIFVRPRALRLFTSRDSFMTENCADLPKGDYLAINQKVGDVGQIPPEQLKACPGVTLTKVYVNQRFTVYQINP